MRLFVFFVYFGPLVSLASAGVVFVVLDFVLSCTRVCLCVPVFDRERALPGVLFEGSVFGILLFLNGFSYFVFFICIIICTFYT